MPAKNHETIYSLGHFYGLRLYYKIKKTNLKLQI